MSFYNDTFTDVAGQPLTSHTSNSGATYTAHPAYPSASAVEVRTGNRVRANAATSNVFNISQAAPGPDHTITCKVYVATTGNSEDTGVLCRVTKTAPKNWYSLTINSGAVRLYRAVNDVFTQLGSLTLGEVAGITYTLTLASQETTISGTVQRDSDNNYLNSSGTWQAAATTAFSVVDTSVPVTSNIGLWVGGLADGDNTGYQISSASIPAAAALTPLQVLDVVAGFGAQGLVRGSVADGSVSSGNILTSSGATFQSSDVGKDICVANGNAAPPVFNAARNPNLNAQTVPPTPTFGCWSGGSLPATKYYVVLTWQSYTGEGGPSAEGSFTIGQNNLLIVVQPSPPGGLVTGWNVYAAAQLQVPTGINFSSSSCTGGYLQGGSTYYYKVTAVDINKPSDGSVGETTASAEASYSPTSGTTNQIQVNWTGVTGAVAYNVYRTRTGGGSGAEHLLAQVPGNTTSFTDTFPDPPSGNPAPPTTNTTGAGREVKQNTSPLPFTGPWVEPTTGLSGGPGALVTKIKSVSPPNQVTLNYSWPFTGPAVSLTATWGVDDSTPLQNWVNAATAGTYGKSILFLPAGQYMITRPLTIIRPTYPGVAGMIIRGAGSEGPDFWTLGYGSQGLSLHSVIVYAGHPSQPALKLDGALGISLTDLAIYGPLGFYATSTYASLAGAPVAGILMRNASSGWPTDGVYLENVAIGLCGTGLLMDNLDVNPEVADGEVRLQLVGFDNCLNFAVRDLNNQGVDYQFRSVNVSASTSNPGFVAVQFDAGGCFRWEGGDLVSVGTVLRLNNQGVGPNDANITLSDLRLEQNGGIQRIIVDTYNPTSAYHGVASNNTILVENITETTETGDNVSPLFYLGPNTNVTVRTSTLYRQPLAKLSNTATSPPVGTNDTTLLLDGVSFPSGVPFSNAISGDLGTYWRSRNCRSATGGGGGSASPRFDESTWIGDGVVAPFRAAFFSQFLPAFGGTAGYFRPGNRQQKYVANEFPLLQQAYGLCTGVYRNADPYHSIVPVLPALPEDSNPGWFDGNSYVTMTQGAFSGIFNLPASSSFTVLAWVRLPTSIVSANLASNPICGNLRTSGTGANFGGWLLDIVNNVPTFKVYNSTGSGTTTSIGLGSSVSGDTWYLLAGTQDVTNSKLLVYLFGPSNPLGLSNSVTITLSTQQATSSSGACTIGQNANASPAVNANQFIEVVGLIGLALTLGQLQNLYSVGVNGG